MGLGELPTHLERGEQDRRAGGEPGLRAAAANARVQEADQGRDCLSCRQDPAYLKISLGLHFPIWKLKQIYQSGWLQELETYSVWYSNSQTRMGCLIGGAWTTYSVKAAREAGKSR
ncbi:hypothetical protein CapIbe_015908 [Capra ibex]